MSYILSNDAFNNHIDLTVIEVAKALFPNTHLTHEWINKNTYSALQTRLNNIRRMNGDVLSFIEKTLQHKQIEFELDDGYKIMEFAKSPLSDVMGVSLHILDSHKEYDNQDMTDIFPEKYFEDLSKQSGLLMLDKESAQLLTNEELQAKYNLSIPIALKNIPDKEYENLSSDEQNALLLSIMKDNFQLPAELRAQYIEIIRIWFEYQYIEQLIELYNSLSTEKLSVLSRTSKVKRTSSDGLTSLSCLHTSLLFQFLKQTGVILKDADLLSNVQLSDCIHELTGFNQQNIRQNLSNPHLSENDLRVVQKKIQQINKLIINQLTSI